MNIISNGTLVRPNGRTWIVQRPLSGDGSQLRAYMESSEGFSKFTLTEPAWGDTAWSKIQAIGAYIFQKMYWTGTNQVSPGVEQYHALYLLQTVTDGNSTDNSGKGPTWDCEAISSTMIGILTAYGVVCRLVYGETQDAASVDITLEAFLPEYNRWIWWHAPTAGYVLTQDGSPASSLQLKYAYINGTYSALTYKSGTASIQTDTGFDQYGAASSDKWWQGVTGGANDATNRSAGGFFYEAAWNTISGRNWNAATDFHNYTQQAYSPAALDTTGSKRVAPPAPLCDTHDLFPSFNSLALISVDADSTSYYLGFDHSMLQIDHLQTSTDDATWSDVYGLSVAIPAEGVGSWYIRAVDVNGVPSNTVQLTY